MSSNPKKSPHPKHTPDLSRPAAEPASVPVASAPDASLDETLVKHGITRVSVDHFYTGGFHYTNVDDAIAQAKRTGTIA